MYNRLLPLLLLPLFSISIYAIDLNNSEAILTQASKATEPIQAELNNILKEQSPQKELILDQPTQKETFLPKINTAKRPTAKSPIIKKPVRDENNISVQDKTVENNQTHQEEINSTKMIEKTVIPTSPPKENNETNATVVKERFNLTKGNSLKGEKIFIEHFKKDCNTTAYKFAGNYAQEEWEEVAESGKFKETIFKLCPNIKESYQESWSSDLYQFFYEYANDSENIPEC